MSGFPQRIVEARRVTTAVCMATNVGSYVPRSIMKCNILVYGSLPKPFLDFRRTCGGTGRLLTTKQRTTTSDRWKSDSAQYPESGVERGKPWREARIHDDYKDMRYLGGGTSAMRLGVG